MRCRGVGVCGVVAGVVVVLPLLLSVLFRTTNMCSKRHVPKGHGYEHVRMSQQIHVHVIISSQRDWEYELARTSQETRGT